MYKQDYNLVLVIYVQAVCMTQVHRHNDVLIIEIMYV